MKPNLLVESGIISDAGKLLLPMERVDMFCGDHAGERALVKIEAIERHASAAMLRYYFGYVVPTLRQALVKTGQLLTDKGVHAMMWAAFPGEHNPDEDIRQAPKTQVCNFIEWLKIVAAEWYSVYIEDPKTI